MFKRYICLITAFAFLMWHPFVYGDSCEHLYEYIVNPPDCTTDGYTLNVCIHCNVEFINEIVPKTGHEVVFEKIVSPTCTDYGFTEASHCNICGEIFDDISDIAPLGHEWAVTVTFENLLNDYSCRRCNEVIDKSSPEYINIESGRILELSHKNTVYEQAVLSLYFTYKNLDDPQKAEISGAGVLENTVKSFILYRMGDIDFSGKIDSRDVSLILADYSDDDSPCDLISDGIVNHADLSVVLSNYNLEQ